MPKFTNPKPEAVLDASGGLASEEQLAVMRYMAEGNGHGIVNAVAGSGKTSTAIWALRQAQPRYGENAQYMAFASANVEDMKQRDPSINSRTCHSIGRRAIVSQFPGVGKKEIQKFRIRGIVDKIKFWHSGEWQTRSALSKVVDKCREAGAGTREEILSVIARMELDLKGDSGFGGRNQQDAEEQELAELAAKAMLAAMEPSSFERGIDFVDMIWLPYVLELPIERKGLLVVDEAQDLSRIQHWIAQKAGERVMIVGDRRQCQPGDTLVSVCGGGQKRIDELKIGEQLVSFDRRGGYIVGLRSQGKEILGIESRDYNGRMITVVAGDKSTTTTPDHRFIVRWADKNFDLFCTYLMRKGDSYRIGQCQLFTSPTETNNGMFHLPIRTRLENADAYWVLGVHESRGEAILEEGVASCRFGVPMATFRSIHNNKWQTPEFLDRYWKTIKKNVDLRKNAKALLEHFGRDIDFPMGGINCGDRRGRETIFKTEACNLIPEIMSVPVLESGKIPAWHPIEVRYKFWRGKVYSMNVDLHHTYIANGIVTCNCLYGFRGADRNGMDRMGADLVSETGLELEEFGLTYTRRCPKAVVELAQKIVPQIKALETAKEGKTGELGELKGLTPGDAVLCRTNAPLVEAAFKLWRQQIPAKIIGKDHGDRMLKFYQACKKETLMATVTEAKRLTDEEVSKFLAMPEGRGEGRAQGALDRLECFVAISMGVSDLGQFEKAVHDLWGEARDMSQMVRLSSIHKFKGMEANRVFVVRPDLIPFPKAKPGDEMYGEECMAYVAVTRAMEELWWVGGRPSLFR